MWLIVTREPLPDKAYWPGRVAFAVIDAVGWPVAFSVWILNLSVPTGVFGPTAVGVAALVALQRLQRATFNNHRYHFTTWRLGKIAAGLLIIGLVMKMVAVR